jgi:uncharacterized membrane protein
LAPRAAKPGREKPKASEGAVTAAAAAAAQPQPASDSAASVDRWLHPRLDWLIAGLILLLVVVHFRHAAVVHLNGDEALHYNLAHQHTIADAYAANNTNAHPPLLILSLHFIIRLIGDSEPLLRALPIFAYAVMLWFTWRWASLALGRETALAMTVLAAFLPPIFNLATEVRHYMLLLASVAAALYFWERAFQQQRKRWFAISAACLCLAIVSHFSASFLVLAYGVASLWRIRQTRLARPLVVVWAAGQCVAAALYAVLYVTQLAHLAGSEVTREAQEGWLRVLYCGGDRFTCLVSNTGMLFEYFFGSVALGAIAALLVVAGLILLARDPDLRRHLWIPAVAFVAACAAAALGQYPLGGSRHSVLIACLTLVPISFALAYAFRRRLAVLAGLLLALVMLWRVTAKPERQVLPAAEQNRAFVQSATAYLRSQVKPAGLVFTDYQSVLLLCYYTDPGKYCVDTRNRYFLEYDLGPYRVVASRKWSLDPTDFVNELRRLKAEYQLLPGAAVWVFDGGWGSPVNRMLALQYSGSEWPGLREFGEHFGVFRIPN